MVLTEKERAPLLPGVPAKKHEVIPELVSLHPPKPAAGSTLAHIARTVLVSHAPAPPSLPASVLPSHGS